MFGLVAGALVLLLNGESPGEKTLGGINYSLPAYFLPCFLFFFFSSQGPPTFSKLIPLINNKRQSLYSRHDPARGLQKTEAILFAAPPKNSHFFCNSRARERARRWELLTPSHAESKAYCLLAFADLSNISIS